MEEKILKNFIRNICGCSAKWNMKFFKKKIIEDIKKQVGKDKVICGLSGVLIQQLQRLNKFCNWKNLICVFVDTGLMRENEEK